MKHLFEIIVFCALLVLSLLALAQADDIGMRDMLVLTKNTSKQGEVAIGVEVLNDEELVALDIPLRFGKPGDAIELIRVDFTQRVANWDVKHAQVDNQAKTVVLGLIGSLAGDWDNVKLGAATKASSISTIATLLFKVQGDFTPSITTFRTKDPRHSLTYIYNRLENGKPQVEEFTPEFTSDASYKTGANLLRYELSENYPNPFNPSTKFTLTVPEAVDYSVRIYNVAGQLVRAIDGHLDAGAHQLTWDGRNNQGTPVASGVYFLRVHAGTLKESRRMLLVR